MSSEHPPIEPPSHPTPREGAPAHKDGPIAPHTGAPSPDVLVVGAGYCGLEIIRRLRARGARLFATARDLDASRAAIEQAGASPLAWTAGQGAPAWPEALTRGPVDLVYTVHAIADDQGDVAAPVRELLDAMADIDLRAIVALSATSVYGDSDGGVVTADTPPTRPPRAADGASTWSAPSSRPAPPAAPAR